MREDNAKKTLQCQTLTIAPPPAYIETTRQLVNGGMLGLYFGLMIYIGIVWSIIRFFQIVHQRDAEMRMITSQWIDEATQKPIPS